MYIKECRWCEMVIEVEKQPLFALHVANCKANPSYQEKIEHLSLLHKGKLKSERFILNKICPKCSTPFVVTATESEIRRNKVKNYCSRACGNSRVCNEDTKQKIRETLMTGGKRYQPTKRGRKRTPKEGVKNYNFICQLCGEVGTEKRYTKNRKYHKECWLGVSGGVKPGSSRGKSGWYKGYWCDSSYELAFIYYCLSNEIEVTRNKKGFLYEYQNKERLYYPDFITSEGYIEIKNYHSELTDAKIAQFPHPIVIYYKEDMYIFLDFIHIMEGKDFIKLYENIE